MTIAKSNCIMNMERIADMLTWRGTIAFLAALVLCGCHRDGVVDQLSEAEERSLARTVSWHMKKVSGGDGLTYEQVHRCMTNAFRMAQERFAIKATYDVIPLYCPLSGWKDNEDVLGDKRHRFVLDVWGCGRRKAWCDDAAYAGDDDPQPVWLVFETFDQESGRCMVVSSSLANLVHGRGSFWSDNGNGGEGLDGKTQYGCNDLMLGAERGPESWVRDVADGKARLYFLLCVGRFFGFRIGRREFESSDWRSEVVDLKAKGLLVEMAPLSRFDNGCFLECL